MIMKRLLMSNQVEKNALEMFTIHYKSAVY